MKILLVNKFLYPKGGDAICTLATGKLLSEKGHEVTYWGMDHPDNPEYPYKEHFISLVDYQKSSGILQQIKLSLKILYSLEARKKIDKIIKRVQPDIVHLHNFAHQISPSILDVFKKHNIPVVMTMHDSKLVCPAYSMYVKGKPCEQCKGGKYINCLRNKCVKGSSLKSLVNCLEMYLHHNLLHIYDKIDTYIAPSRFLMDKVYEFGFKGRVVHLFNFVVLEKFQPSYESGEGGLVYFGRLSHEKGLETLIAAAIRTGMPLNIIGAGPMGAELQAKVDSENAKNIKFSGFKKGDQLFEEIRQSLMVVIPSEVCENNPLSVIESFALGKPVLGARIGGIPELVRDWETGLTFESGSRDDLTEKLNLILDNKSKLPDMGRRARQLVEREMSRQIHYDKLMNIYQKAIKRSA